MDGLVMGRGERYLTTMLCWFGGPVMPGGFHCPPLTAAQGYAQRLGMHPTFRAGAFLCLFYTEAEDPSVSRMVIQGATTNCYLALLLAPCF